MLHWRGMQENLERLYQQVAGEIKTPTPNRVLHILGRPEAGRLTADEFFQTLPPEIQEEFLSRKGNPKQEKLKKFYKNLEDLFEEYSPTDIIRMDVDCIKKDGSIIRERLDEILENDPEP